MNIEVIEYIADGKIYKKTINGIDVSPEKLDIIPTVVIHKFTMKKKDAEKVYGKLFN